MKAGVAAALIAAREAARLGLAGDVVVAAVADEEHASLGVQEALRHVSADAAVVTEPTELELVVAHKGFVWSEIEVTGRAAHGSRPHLGVDAIAEDGRGAHASSRQLDRALGAPLAPAARPRLAARLVIAGGAELSSYPAQCTLGVERRTLPGETARSRGGAGGPARPVPRADPELVAAQRTLLVREPFEIDPAAAIVAPDRRSRHRGAARRRSGRQLLGRLGVHRGRRHPDGALRAGRRGRARPRGWVSLLDTEAVTRT